MYTWILILLFVMGGIGLRFWYVRQRQVAQLRATFLALEERYEALADRELGLRWSAYARLESLEERTQVLSEELFGTLKTQLDRLIYMADRQREGGHIPSEDMRYFSATLELLNLYQSQRKPLGAAEQEKLYHTFREEMQANLHERLLYLEE